MTNTAPFPIDPELQGITIAYRNSTLIADAVLPRVPVGKKEFKWNKFAQDERFTVPNTLVGRKGMPGEVEFGATEEASFTRDYGLDDFIPNDDIEQAPANYNPLGHAVEGITDLILLDREKRASDLLFTKANYTNAATLSSTGQWSDYTNSDPQKAIMTALDVPILRPNVMTIGQAAWTILRQHPKLCKAINRNSGDAGAITREELARLLEIEEVIVGQGFINTAKPGQTPTISRLWGKHASFTYRNKLANTQRGITFGITAQFGSRIAGQIPETKRGLRGGITVRAGESVRELIVAADVGYFFENCVA